MCDSNIKNFTNMLMSDVEKRRSLLTFYKKYDIINYKKIKGVCKMSPCDIFIQNYVDENGCSEVIFIKDLIRNHGEKFQSNNGCQWDQKRL